MAIKMRKTHTTVTSGRNKILEEFLTFKENEQHTSDGDNGIGEEEVASKFIKSSRCSSTIKYELDLRSDEESDNVNRSKKRHKKLTAASFNLGMKFNYANLCPFLMLLFDWQRAKRALHTYSLNSILLLQLLLLPLRRRKQIVCFKSTNLLM